MAAGGMIIYPEEYLAKAAVLSKKYNVHLIADEVATGFGRTGKMFACEHADVKPDFMCLSKGITSGTLPLGVTLTTEKVYKAFYADYKKKKTFYHGHTFTGNPLGCAVAVASIDLFKKEKTIQAGQYPLWGGRCMSEPACCTLPCPMLKCSVHCATCCLQRMCLPDGHTGWSGHFLSPLGGVRSRTLPPRISGPGGRGKF